MIISTTITITITITIIITTILLLIIISIILRGERGPEPVGAAQTQAGSGRSSGPFV